jgi:hypothetical protein
MWDRDAGQVRRVRGRVSEVVLICAFYLCVFRPRCGERVGTHGPSEGLVGHQGAWSANGSDPPATGTLPGWVAQITPRTDTWQCRTVTATPAKRRNGACPPPLPPFSSQPVKTPTLASKPFSQPASPSTMADRCTPPPGIRPPSLVRSPHPPPSPTMTPWKQTSRLFTPRTRRWRWREREHQVRRERPPVG